MFYLKNLLFSDDVAIEIMYETITKVWKLHVSVGYSGKHCELSQF